MRITALLALLVACRTEPPDDVTGPIDGPATRFVVDGITLPSNDEQFGDDLDGDGTPDNVLGDAIVALAAQHDTSSHAADMIAGGRIAMSAYVRRQGDVGAVYLIGDDGRDVAPVHGSFDGDAFRANRARVTDDLGRATVVLPVIDAADPTTLTIERLQIDLAADPTGLVATVRGVVEHDPIVDAAARELAQMLVDDPRAHPDLAAIFDTNHDGVASVDEIRASVLLRSILAADQTLPDGTPALSFGFALHLTPCEDGTCRQTTSSCFDRVRDGDEADVDCGGACALACPAGATCTAAADCDARACDAGACAAATCNDGVADGREGDVDCGGSCATKCALGQQCFASIDCASMHCSACVPGQFNETCSGAGICEH